MADYITLPQYKLRYGITNPAKDVWLAENITAASRKADQICHRQFGPHTGAATARYFTPSSWSWVSIDDAYEITSVAVDDNDDGTYATAWAATDYETDPANGVGPDGQTGWPIETLRTIGTRTFPTCNRRRAVKVTAKWGWAAFPDAVIEASYLFTARFSYEIGVPGGITAPNVEFGLSGTVLPRPYTAEGLLQPFMRTSKVIGVAG